MLVVTFILRSQKAKLYLFSSKMMDLRVELFFSFCSCGLRTGEAKMRLKINFSKNKCLIVNRIYVPVRVRPSSFFLRLASSDRPKFLAFGKKKSNVVVKPFFT